MQICCTHTLPAYMFSFGNCFSIYFVLIFVISIYFLIQFCSYCCFLFIFYVNIFECRKFSAALLIFIWVQQRSIQFSFFLERVVFKFWSQLARNILYFLTSVSPFGKNVFKKIHLLIPNLKYRLFYLFFNPS